MLNEVFNFESENTKLDHSSPELKNEPHSLREIDDHSAIFHKRNNLHASRSF